MPFSSQTDLTSETMPYSDYVNPDLLPRVRSASVSWDVEHSCRALAPIEEWVAAHQLDENYGKKV